MIKLFLHTFSLVDQAVTVLSHLCGFCADEQEQDGDKLLFLSESDRDYCQSCRFPLRPDDDD